MRNSLGLNPSAHLAKLDGESLVISTWTTSSVSNFTFTEEEKRVSFTVKELSDKGSTVINVERLIRGPFVVSIDGKVVKHDVTEDELHGEDPNWTEVGFDYGKGTHNIAISGASVVPEFPFGMLLPIAAGIGATIV